jgi:hypothetical protein
MAVISFAQLIDGYEEMTGGMVMQGLLGIAAFGAGGVWLVRRFPYNRDDD